MRSNKVRGATAMPRLVEAIATRNVDGHIQALAIGQFENLLITTEALVADLPKDEKTVSAPAMNF